MIAMIGVFRSKGGTSIFFTFIYFFCDCHVNKTRDNLTFKTYGVSLFKSFHTSFINLHLALFYYMDYKCWYMQKSKTIRSLYEVDMREDIDRQCRFFLVLHSNKFFKTSSQIKSSSSNVLFMIRLSLIH